MAGPPSGSSSTGTEMPDATAAGSIVRQLRAPDPDSRDVALLRTRLYRFSDDPRHYVLAEALEERLLTGHRLRPSTLTHVRQCLTAIRAHGQRSEERRVGKEG